MVALAIVFLVAASIALAIDAAAHFDSPLGLRLNYSPVWYGTRYIGIVSAALLALDVVTGGC